MIQTERLLLRRAQMSDVGDLHRVFSDARAMRYWDSLPYSQVAQTEAFVRAMVDASPETSDEFVIELEGRVIGKAGAWRMEEVGFIFHPDHWGRGIAFEALSALIPHAFAALPIDRLVADVDPRNAASLGVLSKLGFAETGRAERTMQVGDEWCDSVYLELPRPA